MRSDDASGAVSNYGAVLRERLHRRAAKRHPALPSALNMFGPAGTAATVRDVARETGLSQRRFIELFKAQVGVAPKLFCRLPRFQQARTLAAQIVPSSQSAGRPLEG